MIWTVKYILMVALVLPGGRIFWDQTENCRVFARREKMQYFIDNQPTNDYGLGTHWLNFTVDSCDVWMEDCFGEN